eukprot:TRINITY_DN5537_c0_g3_i1.p1 TRINITY_DN5537_c0_g3~~TRINITY_DN5537_c0_g3_i1.p1  ORF type:complete len:708 (-),score=106.31 TRINITY_DN5537_c0_g3_i1:150-2273(-)
MGDKGSELARILQRRRQEVECNGSQFTKDRAQDNSADAASDQRHHSQFTPRSEKQPITRLPNFSLETSPRSEEPPTATVTRQRRLRASTTPRTPSRLLRSGFGMVEGPAVTSTQPDTGVKSLPLNKSFVTSTEEAAPRPTVVPPVSPTGSNCSCSTASTARCCAPAKTAQDAKPKTVAQVRRTCNALRSASNASCCLPVGTAAEVSADLAPGEPGMCDSACDANTVAYRVPPVTAVGKLHAAEHVTCSSAHAGLACEQECMTRVAAVTLNIPSGLGLCSETSSDQVTSSPASSSSARSVRAAAPLSTDNLWQAVAKGNLQTLEELVSKDGLSTGRLVDMNGHTIFWNSLAFQQPEVALFLLAKFPPWTEEGTGVNLQEVHPERGDTLLHLCLHVTHFSEPAAELFRLIFTGGCKGDTAERGMNATDHKVLWCQENQDGRTFFHEAADRLNFWVLRFALSWSPEIASLLWACDSKGQCPLEVLLRRVQAPMFPPGPPRLQASHPAWMDFSKYAPSSVASAFADVELQVEDVAAEDGISSVMAHRAVLGACSGTLHDMLLRAEAGRPFLIDPMCCRSKRVLACALDFVYHANLSCDFADNGFLLWQLLCLCVHYGLPPPLTKYARSTLLQTLSDQKFASILPVLLQACHEVGLSSEEVCFVSCAILRSPEAALPDGHGKEAQDQRTQVLLAALAEVERHALRQSSEGFL